MSEETTTPAAEQKLADLVKANPKLQDELNGMMAENRKKLTTQNQELVTQLETLKANTALTTEERDALQGQISPLEQQYLSKEELVKREAGKEAKKLQDNLAKTNEERDIWKGMYTSATIDRALQDAAIETEAENPSQIVDMLRARTQLAEVIVDGNPTGQYNPIVKFNDTNEAGKAVVLDLSPVDALKRMKELKQHHNLFKGTATSGLGESGSSAETGKAPFLEDIIGDPAKYAKWRKENPDLPVEKLRRKS
jgi:hypothetical protein